MSMEMLRSGRVETTTVPAFDKSPFFIRSRKYPWLTVEIRSNKPLVSLLNCGLLSLCCIGFSGCRGSFNPFTRSSSEPSFDRLLELEANSPNAQTGDPSKESQHPQVSQRRPGSRQAASRHEGNLQRDDLQQDGFDEADPEQLELLRQTQIALKNRSQVGLSGDPRTVSSPVDGVADSEEFQTVRSQAKFDPEDAVEDGIVAIRLSDREEVDAVPSTSPANRSEPKRSPSTDQQTANQSGPSQSTSSPVRPAGFNRYVEEGIAPAVTPAASPAVTQAVSLTVTRDVAQDVAQDVTQDLTQAVAQDVGSAVVQAGAENAATKVVQWSWDEHLKEAMRQLAASQYADESSTIRPSDRMREEVILRLLALAIGDRERMTDSVEALQPAEQDYFRHQLTALMDAIDPNANPVSSRKWALVMLNQRKANDYLATLSNLEINQLSFCTEVESFGVTERFPKYQFNPDQEVLLYCELDNFTSEKSKDGKGFETQLQGSYEIVDTSGRRVADQILPMDSHICRNRRRDYFIAYRIYMPQSISPGHYTLRLTIEDVKGRKFGQSDIDFQIQ
jgi:hypothetical protein